jgi:hypothetical protein
MTVMPTIADPRLQSLYQHWLDKRQGRPMPRRADIDPLEIPGAVWPHVMILDIVYHDGVPRFRYRRAGAVYWRALGREPTGLFVDEVVPETAGYRDYVLGVYREMLSCRRPIYTENEFALQNWDQPLTVRRVTLPLSSDGTAMDMIITGHVFEHEELSTDWGLSQVCGLSERVRLVLTES